MSLSMCKKREKRDSGATLNKKERGKSEKREGEERTSVRVSEKGLPP
jgi:hypothetical protein